MSIRTDLTDDAVSIDGQYLEDLISGYITITSHGRETLTPDLSIYEAENRDGTSVKSLRYPERIITVEFYLEGTDESSLISRLNTLNTILSSEESEFIFNSEPDKYFIGKAVLQTDTTKYIDCIKGEYQIYCSDPFKYAVNETGPISLSSAYDTSDTDEYDPEETYQTGDMVKHLDGTVTKLYECSADNTTGTWDSSKWSLVSNLAFTVNNDGGYKTYPRFVVNFAEDETSGSIGTDGNSGFIQFAKVLDEETRYRLQFGDEESELPVVGNGFDINFTKTNNTLGGFNNESTGTVIKNFTDAGQASGSSSGIKPKYGSGSGWHGSLITKNVTAAADFTLKFSQLISLTNKKQMFGFMALCLDSSNNIVAGVRYTKSSKTGYSGSIDYIIGDQVKKTASGQNFKKTGSYGYTKKTKKKASVIRDGESYIKRTGSVIKIKLAGDSKVSYFYPSSTSAISKIGFFFVKNGSNANPSANILRTAKFTASSTENSFNSGCVLEVDCNKASVLLDTVSAPELGDVGNEWSDFYLDVGDNLIFVAWSDWTVSAPTFQMYYRKRWI